MRKLVVSTLVSLDGVIESPNRWSLFDDEAAQLSMQELEKYDAFVMGRVTYEFFKANWGSVSGNPYIDRAAEGPAREGPHQVRPKPPRRHTPARAPRRRTPRVGHARRGRHRPAPVRRCRDLVPQAHAHQRPQARQQLGHSSLTRPAKTANRAAVTDTRICGASAELIIKPRGREASLHRHREAHEPYAVLAGSGRVKLDHALVDLIELDRLRRS